MEKNSEIQHENKRKQPTVAVNLNPHQVRKGRPANVIWNHLDPPGGRQERADLQKAGPFNQVYEPAPKNNQRWPKQYAKYNSPKVYVEQMKQQSPEEGKGAMYMDPRTFID